MRRAHRGMENSKSPTQMKLIWVEFFIWGYAKEMGYAEGYNFDLGVREYQKVENPCFKPTFKPKNNM
jgi:hypothetical protein